MKKFLFIIIFFQIFNFYLFKSIQRIIPDKKLILKEVQMNKEILLELNKNDLSKYQKYKVMVHYISSYALSFEISIICDDIHLIKNIDQKNDIKLNDFSEFDFQTNEKKIPTQCGIDYDKGERRLIDGTHYVHGTEDEIKAWMN